jgi:UDP-N-acetylglucosamine 4,6-dehydratase
LPPFSRSTGGTGSFGHAVVDRFLKTGIKEIRILSRDEKKQEDMRIHYANDKLKFYIGDVRDYDSIVGAFKGVDFVFQRRRLKTGSFLRVLSDGSGEDQRSWFQ